MMKKYIACSGPAQILTPNSFSLRQASAQSGVAVDPDFLYTRVRAVSAGDLHGANNNGDYFCTQEIRRAWNTFTNKGVFVNHQSQDVEKCRGRIIKSYLIDRPKECWVELLLGVDERAYPQLARSIRKGYVRNVSMGATVRYSYCSVCNNQAYNEHQYCDHLKNYKGARFANQHVYEDNRDIGFFEISFVVDGADPDASVLEVYDNIVAAANYENYRVASVTRDMKKVASISSEKSSVTRVGEYLRALKQARYTPQMTRLALKDKFADLTEDDLNSLTSQASVEQYNFKYTGKTNDSMLMILSQTTPAHRTSQIKTF